MQLGRPAEVVQPEQVVRRVLAGELDVVVRRRHGRRSRRPSATSSGGASPTEGRPSRSSWRSCSGRTGHRAAEAGGPRPTLPTVPPPRASSVVRTPSRPLTNGSRPSRIAPTRSRSWSRVGLEADRIVGVERIERRLLEHRLPAAAGVASAHRPVRVELEDALRSRDQELHRRPEAGRRQLVGQPDLDEHAVRQPVLRHRALLDGRRVGVGRELGEGRLRIRARQPSDDVAGVRPPVGVGRHLRAIGLPRIGRDVPAGRRAHDPDHPDRPDPALVDEPSGPPSVRPGTCAATRRRAARRPRPRRQPSRAASARVDVIGFSTRTCLPACAAASTSGRWAGTGVATTTALMSSRSRRASGESSGTP